MANEKSKLSKNDQQMEAWGNACILFIKGLGYGARALKRERNKLIGFLLVTILCFTMFFCKTAIIDALRLPPGFHVLKAALTAVPLTPLFVLYLLGQPDHRPDEFAAKFAEIGFCGKGKTFPQLLRREEDGKKVIYSFRSPGLDIADWRLQQSKLETALNLNILKIEPAKGTKQIIRLHTVPAEHSLETNIPWNNQMIREKDFEITVGRGILEDVVFDLNKVPHALIAGVTGSGKSVLLRCILWQAIVKGARIYMIDFKGGVEFGKQYEQFGDVITDRQEALEMLKELTKENELRLNLFRACGVKNIVEYNKMHPENQLCRIMLFCDEIAEMLDKTGLASSDKAIYYELEKELSTLARLARAPGINMMLATQRPDAKVLTGQIKNNLPIRISGRMVDPQASEMVLGNIKASLLGDTLGRFMYTIGSDTYEFQAYNFNDDAIGGSNRNYVVGKMLVEEERHEETEEDEGEPIKLSKAVNSTGEEEGEEDEFFGF